MQKLPVLEIQLFIQFNNYQIYYVIHDKLCNVFMKFSDCTIVSKTCVDTFLIKWALRRYLTR